MQEFSYEVMLKGFTVIADLFSQVQPKGYAVFMNVDECLPLSEVMIDKGVSFVQSNKAADLVKSRLGEAIDNKNYTLLHVDDRFMQFFWVELSQAVLLRGGFICNYDCEKQILACYSYTYKGWVKKPVIDVRDLFDFIMNDTGKHLYSIVLEWNATLHEKAEHKIKQLKVM